MDSFRFLEFKIIKLTNQRLKIKNKKHKKIQMKKLLISTFILMSISNLVFASEASIKTTISAIQSYPDYGNGDVVFSISTPSDICKGYWLSPNSKGYAANLSLLLSAYHASSKVYVYGLTEQSNKWPGSSTKHCKLYSVRLTK